jgi:hypothetical protein
MSPRTGRKPKPWFLRSAYSPARHFCLNGRASAVVQGQRAHSPANGRSGGRRAGRLRDHRRPFCALPSGIFGKCMTAFLFGTRPADCADPPPSDDPYALAPVVSAATKSSNSASFGHDLEPAGGLVFLPIAGMPRCGITTGVTGRRRRRHLSSSAPLIRTRRSPRPFPWNPPENSRLSQPMISFLCIRRQSLARRLRAWWQCSKCSGIRRPRYRGQV